MFVFFWVGSDRGQGILDELDQDRQPYWDDKSYVSKLKEGRFLFEQNYVQKRASKQLIIDRTIRGIIDSKSCGGIQKRKDKLGTPTSVTAKISRNRSQKRRTSFTRHHLSLPVVLVETNKAKFDNQPVAPPPLVHEEEESTELEHEEEGMIDYKDVKSTNDVRSAAPSIHEAEESIAFEEQILIDNPVKNLKEPRICHVDDQAVKSTFDDECLTATKLHEEEETMDFEEQSTIHKPVTNLMEHRSSTTQEDGIEDEHIIQDTQEVEVVSVISSSGPGEQLAGPPISVHEARLRMEQNRSFLKDLVFLRTFLEGPSVRYCEG